jgi:hypothetical protein
MARKNYQIDEVLRSLSRKHDVKVFGTTIQILTGKDLSFPRINDLGNKSWGKIDFLKNYCGFKVIHLDKFDPKAI